MAARILPVEDWAHSRAAWNRYLNLLERSAERLENDVTAWLEKMRAKGADIDGRQWRSYQESMLARVKREMTALETALKRPTKGILEEMQERQLQWFEASFRDNPQLIETFAEFQSRQGLVIANAEVDIGKRIKAMTRRFQTVANGELKRLMADAEQRIREGELTGMPVGEIVTDLRQSVIGLAPGQRARGVTAAMRTVVRTQLSQINFDTMDDFAKSEPSIIGVRIQRGPGPCPANVCGVGLGLELNEIGVFLYDINPPPLIPLHPNSFVAVVGFVFEGDQEAMAEARELKQTLSRSIVYRGYVKSREAGRDAVQSHLRQQRRTQKRAA